jgi:hypothetical protein
MSGVTGREAKFAFAKFGAGSWGVAASVTKGHYFNSSGGMRLQPARINDEALGQAFLGSGDLGDVTAPDLTWVGRSRYDDHGYILDALAMGSPTAPTIVTSTAGQTTSYQHIIDLANDIDGLGLTGAFDKVRFVDELTSAKVYGFSEAVGAGGVMDRSYRIIGSKPTNISSTNTRSTVNGASFPALGNRVLRQQGTFRLNAQDGNSLVAADAIKAETVELSFERPQDAPHVFGQDFVHEPADNGFPVPRIVIQYPRMTATSAESLYAALRSNTKWKADWTFLGAFINSTDRYMRKYEFPQLELDETNGFDIDGATQVKPQATFTAKMAATSPANMPVVNPFRLTLINTQAAGAFD